MKIWSDTKLWSIEALTNEAQKELDKEITKKGARCFADNFGGVKYFIKYAESYPKKFKLYELTD